MTVLVTDPTPPRLLVTERVLRVRYVLLATIAAASAVLAGGRGDWDKFVEAGHALVGRDGLQVYVRSPDTQTGPVALLLARVFSFTPRNGFVLCTIVVAALGLVTIRTIERSASADRRTQVVTLFGGALVSFTWAKLGGYGHLDDAIVLSAAVGATAAVGRGRSVGAALLLGFGLAVKPWAVIFLPLLLSVADTTPGDHVSSDETSTSSTHRRILARAAPVALAGLIGGACWLPFLVAAPATMDTIKPTVSIAPDSVLHLLRFVDESELDLLRPIQFGLALALGVLLVRRQRVAHVVLAVVAVRMLTDPGTWSYYTPGLLVGALMADVRWRRLAVPVATGVVWLLLGPTWVIDNGDLRAALRLIVCGGAIAWAISGPSPSAVRSCPSSGPSAAD